MQELYKGKRPSFCDKNLTIMSNIRTLNTKANHQSIFLNQTFALRFFGKFQVFDFRQLSIKYCLLII